MPIPKQRTKKSTPAKHPDNGFLDRVPREALSRVLVAGLRHKETPEAVDAARLALARLERTLAKLGAGTAA
ncbi:MAG: hypothetical protein F9K18_01155 [Thermoanaerobaculia bacterium]|nr:MAG: hypothetical protein F9K18_01155 [Thermoanaerobaculia bacterium]